MATQDKQQEFDEAYSSGLEQHSKGNYQQAIIYYTKVIELEPNHILAYFFRGNAYYILKQYDKAASDFSKMIELNSEAAYAYTARGIAYSELKQYDEAIADYNKAIELDPDVAYAYRNRGNTYNKIKQYDKALADCNKAIELNPNYADAYSNRGQAYYELKQYDKTIADYNRAIELDPNFTRAYSNRGDVYCKLKQYDKAVADYLRAMELGSDDPDIMDKYEDALAALNSQKQATNVAQPVAVQMTQAIPQVVPARAAKAELSPQERRKLRQYLTTRFSLSDLRVLAFDLDINYQSFPHNTIDDFALEFIAHCQRAGQLSDLIELALELRPDPDIAQLLRR